MIPKFELGKAVELAKKYEVGRLFMLGSALRGSPKGIKDYDFAVLDIPPENFFKFYGALMGAMSKNVDLIDLSGEMTKFKEIVLKEGKLIYDKGTA
ncbi:MAG: nucleotidyltransferase domain-containing protein [Elusimicrobia bacterium]|nr:nucleotidyltransferase domain-containing protein [Elusimicrobiota bacterium]